MSYGDYVALGLADTVSIDIPADAQRSAAVLQSLVGWGVPQSIAADLGAAEMLAVVGAMRAPFPRFPLIVIAQGPGQPLHEQVVLAEFLAGYGYVVVGSSSPSVSPAPTGETAGADVERQADALAFVISQVRTRRDVAERFIGLIGYDAGSAAALALAMRNRGIRALVSLDGPIGTSVARTSLGRSPSFNAPRGTPGVLHIHQELDSTVTQDFEFLASLPVSELWLAKTRNLRHQHFTTLGPAVSAFPPTWAPTAGTRSAGSEYGNVLRLAKSFLDAQLKGDEESFRMGPALPVERIQMGTRR